MFAWLALLLSVFIVVLLIGLVIGAAGIFIVTVIRIIKYLDRGE